jgi:hypothetical protein
VVRPKALSRLPADRPVSQFASRRVVLPRHVRECYESGARNWWIYTWKKSNPGVKQRVPYHCNSWRCPHCARHEAAVTFARIKEACEPLDPRGFVFAVLTIDRNGFFTAEGKPLHRNAQEAYRALGSKSEAFIKRVRRWLLRRGAARLGMKVEEYREWLKLNNQREPIENRWFAVVEAHRSGWPHMNLVIHCPELAEWVESRTARAERLLQRWGCAGIERKKRLLNGTLRRLAMASGWGKQSTIERARSIDALNGYVTKLAGLADATSGEIAKITQAPDNAPERFRRLRSGVGFLPPRRKNEEVTGTLVRRELGKWGTRQAVPLHKATNDAQAELMAQCCYIEEDQFARDAAYEHWNHATRAGPTDKLRAPPVQVFQGLSLVS